MLSEIIGKSNPSARANLATVISSIACERNSADGLWAEACDRCLTYIEKNILPLPPGIGTARISREFSGEDKIVIRVPFPSGKEKAVTAKPVFGGVLVEVYGATSDELFIASQVQQDYSTALTSYIDENGSLAKHCAGFYEMARKKAKENAKHVANNLLKKSIVAV